MGDKFAVAVRKEYPPGVIGPISLQSVVTTDLDFVVYDVSLRVPGNPIKLSETPGQLHTPAPAFGEHTREVLREWGMTMRRSAG